MKYTIAAVLLAATLQAAELPPHAVAVDNFGTWSCEKGFTLKNHQCVSEADVKRNQFEVSTLPSAGEGSSEPRSCPSGGCPPPRGPRTTVVETVHVPSWADRGSIGRLPSGGGGISSTYTVIRSY